jgi:hypothetical protein
MSRRVLSAIAIAIVAAVGAGLLVTGAGATNAQPVVPRSTYVGDVQAAAKALTRFGTILQNADDLDAIRAHATQARTALRHFDRHVYVLSRYRLTERRLDRRRANLAHTGPPVTAILSRFLDAAVVGDEALVSRLVPIVARRIAAFQKAATG